MKQMDSILYCKLSIFQLELRINLKLNFANITKARVCDIYTFTKKRLSSKIKTFGSHEQATISTTDFRSPAKAKKVKPLWLKGTNVTLLGERHT